MIPAISWFYLRPNSMILKKKIQIKFFFFADFFFPKFFFGFFFSFLRSKSRNDGEFTNLMPEIESRNGGDHEFWNHEMRGSPVSWKHKAYENHKNAPSEIVSTQSETTACVCLNFCKKFQTHCLLDLLLPDIPMFFFPWTSRY